MVLLLLTHKRSLYPVALCHVCATFSKFVQPTHRILQVDSTRVEVRIGRADRRVSEEFLDMVKWHALFQPTRASFMPEIMKV